MQKFGYIINPTSVTAYEVSKNLIDYSSAKGTIIVLPRSLLLSLTEEEIRVNAMEPSYVLFLASAISS